MSETLIKAEHVSKKFCRSLKRSLWYGTKDVLRSMNPWSRETDQGADGAAEPQLRPHEFWALRDVSFEVKRGECLGLIGHNGAGKSTLLKILNGLIRPDSGRVTMRGRVGAMIELGAGFNPILTGRENVFNQAALLGLSYEETKKKFDAIVNFSEIGDAIDMPLQNYSSGMKVRLGFAVSSQLEPDILLIDEVLAVGDVGFRAKCLARIGELRDRAAFILVSHSMPQIARVSTQVLHLTHGTKKLLTDNISAGMESYYGEFGNEKKTITGTGLIEVVQLTATSTSGQAQLGGILTVKHGEPIAFEIGVRFQSPCSEATIQLLIWNQEMTPILEILGPELGRVLITPNSNGTVLIRTTLPTVLLNSGNYTLSVILLSPDGLTTHCNFDNALTISANSNNSAASFSLATHWEPADSSAV